MYFILEQKTRSLARAMESWLLLFNRMIILDRGNKMIFLIGISVIKVLVDCLSICIMLKYFDEDILIVGL